jgi:hypothetical protein
MNTALKWRPSQRATALMATAMVAVGLAAALAHSSQGPARYGVADNGVINTDDHGVIHRYGVINADGVGGTGRAPAHGGSSVSPDGIQGSGRVLA